jgi:hypothetical protein
MNRSAGVPPAAASPGPAPGEFVRLSRPQGAAADPAGRDALRSRVHGASACRGVLSMNLVAQTFLSGGSRDFPVPCFGYWGLESPQNPAASGTGKPALHRCGSPRHRMSGFKGAGRDRSPGQCLHEPACSGGHPACSRHRGIAASSPAEGGANIPPCSNRQCHSGRRDAGPLRQTGCLPPQSMVPKRVPRPMEAAYEPQGRTSRRRGMRAVGNNPDALVGNRGAQRTDAPDLCEFKGAWRVSISEKYFHEPKAALTDFQRVGCWMLNVRCSIHALPGSWSRGAVLRRRSLLTSARLSLIRSVCTLNPSARGELSAAFPI